MPLKPHEEVTISIPAVPQRSGRLPRRASLERAEMQVEL